MTHELSVVIIDDDEWKRTGMRQRLDAFEEIIVTADVDQDAAANWPLDAWRDVDAALVDIFDDRGVGEIGTDLYSGIRVAERVRDMRDLRCIAITPSCAHPLVQLRLLQARPDYCYHRYQLGDITALLEAVRFPDRDQRPQAPEDRVIRDLGARRLRANDLVDAYENSPLCGKLRDGIGHKHLERLGVSRRAVDRLKRQAVDLGFDMFEAHPSEPYPTRDPATSPRWPTVRTLLLQLLGRKDAPWSEHDMPWWDQPR